MSATHSLDLFDFDFWALPFEAHSFFLETSADKYGIAAAVVREALRGEGRLGKRKVRLKKALEDGDEAAICREIAGIYRSALKNSKSAKSCEATERSLEFSLVNADENGVDELFERIAALPQVDREITFFEFYSENFFSYQREDWAFVAEKVGVNFDRIRRIAGVDEMPFPVALDGRQLIFDFAA
jgi:hypothetical protein